MGIVFPNASIARRWNGALQARLARAPLESFIKSRSLIPACVAVAQDTDDVTRATVHLLEAAFERHGGDRANNLLISQHETVGHLACIVSRSLATLIEKPDVWRIAALLSIAQLLTPCIGLTAAAVTSAAHVRRFEVASEESSMDAQVSRGTADAVSHYTPAALIRVTGLIASSIGSTVSPRRPVASTDTRALAR